MRVCYTIHEDVSSLFWGEDRSKIAGIKESGRYNHFLSLIQLQLSSHSIS